MSEFFFQLKCMYPAATERFFLWGYVLVCIFGSKSFSNAEQQHITAVTVYTHNKTNALSSLTPFSTNQTINKLLNVCALCASSSVSSFFCQCLLLFAYMQSMYVRGVCVLVSLFWPQANKIRSFKNFEAFYFQFSSLVNWYNFTFNETIWIYIHTHICMFL